MDNVLVSPHMSGDVIGWERACIDLFMRNLERWNRAEPLDNVVDKQALRAAEPDAAATV